METLAVVKGVGVVVPSNSIPLLFIIVPSVQGRCNGVGGVTGIDAASSTRLAGELCNTVRQYDTFAWCTAQEDYGEHTKAEAESEREIGLARTEPPRSPKRKKT